MDNRLSTSAMASRIISRGLLSSKSRQTLYSLPSSSMINGIETKDSRAVSNQHHVSLRPKLLEILKHKLSYGAKILPLGREGRIFTKSFSIRDTEKLFHATRCSIYTTAGPIAGVLFITTERVGFCSDRSIKTYSAAGEVFKFQYKVSIPLGKIEGVEERVNTKRPSNKYAELVTVDDFSFWFLGFPNYKKTLRFLLQRVESVTTA
ncbi:putative GEM-like protein 8 [Bidens hawaiensis]|uniref:putative GEM-like protein 8 n=1 Tax=Bidens hawaiensis TaxID=980011 RepID=UPI00404A49BC